MKGGQLLDYAIVCGEVLAKGHARSGDACVLSGYCGRSDRLDKAISRFAFNYADQVEADYEQFLKAIRRGRLPKPALLAADKQKTVAPVASKR